MNRIAGSHVFDCFQPEGIENMYSLRGRELSQGFAAALEQQQQNQPKIPPASDSACLF